MDFKAHATSLLGTDTVAKIEASHPNINWGGLLSLLTKNLPIILQLLQGFGVTIPTLPGLPTATGTSA